MLLVEGESDCWTGWLHGLPVLGIPGKSVWRTEWASHLKGLKVVLWQEPAAEDLTRRVVRDIPELGVIIAPDGIKDISDAHGSGHDVPALVSVLRAGAVPGSDWLAEQTQAVEQKSTDELSARARRVLDSQDPLTSAESAIRAMGYGGDLRPALVTYLAATSRVLAMRAGGMPVHLLLLGLPSAGKSYTVNTVLRLLPEEAFHIIDAGSPRVLIYDDAELRHRVVIFGEADSLPAGEDNPAASAIRNLLQDHRLHYKVTVRDPESGGFTVREVSKEGPTVLITTATRKLGEQLDTRLFSLDVPDDQNQVRSALEAQASLELDGIRTPDDALIAFQALLQVKAPWDVVVPFVGSLAHLIGQSPAAPRILRDFARLLSLIKSVTVLRHERRSRDSRGRLVAEVEDYVQVFDLIGDLYSANVSGASEKIRQVVEAVAQLKERDEEHVTATMVANALGINKMAASRRINAALRGGWLIHRDEKKKRPLDLDVGEPLPAVSGLPRPELLSCNAVTPLTDGSREESLTMRRVAESAPARLEEVAEWIA